MAKAERKPKAKQVRKEAPHNQKRNYQQTNSTTMKPTNYEVDLGPSRLYTKKDETQLSTLFVLALVATAFIVWFEWSGTADAFINYVANIVLWLRSA